MNEENYNNANTRTIKERMTKAFRELRKLNIIAKQNFLCCQSCGVSAISEEMEKKQMRGYAFYHRQDNDNLLKEGSVYISYSDVEIGRLVCDKLQTAGLNIMWDGNIQNRIQVIGINRKL